ncbi:alpha/beta fold hydrolase [Frigidibacter sp. MR17.24]|uniref:alpha/beta fold hydrolase n=1 Tax=Frigidibacter sp. MR17.24 TaxID=3127345 RepID=UPI0030131439
MLNTVLHGQPTDRPPLVIVHGLFGSARNWGAVAKRLSADRLVVTLDQRNHGDSFRAETQSYADMAGDVAEVIAAHAGPGGQVDLVGHSMGGKTAMQLALTDPAPIRRLVVADIAPVAYDHTQMPLVEAMRDLDLSGLDSRAEADRRLAGRVADPGTRAFLLQSLDLRADPPRWKLNLPVLGREMAGIVGWPGTTGQHAGPTLFLTGALSDYVRPEHRDTIKALFPQAKFAKIPGAGHWLHAERPREFEAAVATFLA